MSGTTYCGATVPHNAHRYRVSGSGFVYVCNGELSEYFNDPLGRGPVPDLDVDLVNHPPHYTSHPSGIECIQVTEHMNFNVGNAVKYLWRADLKGGVEDLEKAAWYVAREIARRS